MNMEKIIECVPNFSEGRDLGKVEKIVDWYRQLESHYIKNTPNGKMVLFPSNIHYQVNKNLTLAYEILIEQLDILGLL
jgi:hypothetical protein